MADSAPKDDTTPPTGAASASAPAAAGGPGAEPKTEPNTEPAAMLQPSHWEGTAAAEEQTADDAADDDGDSALGDDSASSNASISSSILEYRILHGRTYHADREDLQYWQSNDAQATQSLDVIHHMSTLTMDGKLHFSPLDKSSISKVLDLGTGTGIWAIDFGDENPNVEVVGTDISPIQPTWVPPNVKFEIENFTQDWTFSENSFDFVHMRYLYGSVPDWFELYRQAYRVCKPGGWIESYEGDPMCYSDDGSLQEGHAIAEWGKFFHEGAKKMGRVFTPLPDSLQEKGMKAAGFVDIHSHSMKVPVGDWPKDEKLKEIGRFIRLGVETDPEGYVSFMANLLDGWTQPQVMLYCAQLRRELKSKKIHSYYRQRVVWAQKPAAR